MQHPEPGFYQHYKGGVYEVIGVGRHSETLEELVIYKAIGQAPSLWLRPLSMFMETLMIEGKEVARFRKMHQAPGTNL